MKWHDYTLLCTTKIVILDIVIWLSVSVDTSIQNDYIITAISITIYDTLIQIKVLLLQGHVQI